MKIDFHTHILAGLDDGSTSREMSRAMLSSLYSQQVDVVVLTPHYYSHHKPIAEFIPQQQHAYRKLCATLTEESPKLVLGAEVYFSDYLFNNTDLSPLCINGTRTMLLELPYNKIIDNRTIDKVERLIGEYNVTPVLAHVERYPSLIRNRQGMERLLRLGCALQVNLPSFAAFGRRSLLSLVRKGYIGALGTDAHNLDTRPPQYNEGYRWLEKNIPAEQLDDIQRNMELLLGVE